MSFARAFSTRRNKPDMEISTPLHVGRAASQRGGRPVLRALISSPMALVSTSNHQVCNAHAIAGTAPIEIRSVSASSTASSSGDESDTSISSDRSCGTMTDASSIDISPITPEAEPNHLTSYFKPAVDTSSRCSSGNVSPVDSARPSFDVTPKIPQRVPSHSKRAHEVLHRKRSIQRMLSPPPSREERSSTEIFSQSLTSFVEAPKENPFGNELAQLEEVAEEFGHVVRDVEAEADAAYMDYRGLGHYNASEYMSEIQTLIHAMFADEQPSPQDFGGFF